MIAVIPCAGEGVRMRPLTLTKPKQLLEIAGKPILEHIFENLPDEINEVILVVGYLGDKIRDYFGGEFGGRKVQYVVQENTTGTWVALLKAKPFLNEKKFLVLLGDDVLDKASIEKCLKHDLAVLVGEVEDPRRFGVVVTNETGKILDFVEKPKNPPSNLANTGVQVLDSKIFDYPARRHPNGEFYLTDSISQLAREYDVFVEHAKMWLSIATPEDLKRIDENFKTLARNI